ncbi:MAG: hypothetical protein WC679_12380 [Bacteroidales bacterium]|jgi:hypothetical protein
MGYIVLNRKGKILSNHTSLKAANRKIMNTSARWGDHKILTPSGKILDHPYDVKKRLERKPVQRKSLFRGYRI